MPRNYQRRHVDADFDGHAPHRRDPDSTPPIVISADTQRNLVQLAENQRALSTIAQSIGSLSAGRYNSANGVLEGFAPNATEHPDLMKINDQRPPLGLQMGVAGIPIYNGVINDPAEYNRDFYWRDGVAKYDEMYRSDPQVRQATAVMARPIRRAKWDIQPVSDAAIDVQIASAVKSALFDDMCFYTDDGEEIIQTWDDILRHLLLMFVYGFSTMEYVWRKDKDGWTKWANWAPILPRTVWRWWTGGSGELLGIQQYAYKDGLFQLIEIPAKKLLRVAYDQQGNNYDGISPLRSSYPNWFYKQQYTAIQSVGIERAGLPMPILHLPPTASAADYARAKQIGENIRANEKMHAVLPSDWTIQYLQGTANIEQISSAIEFHDKMIARNVGAMFLNLGGQRGAFNLDKSQTQTFMQAIQAEADYIAERISASAIRKFVKANYDGVKVYPKLVCNKISTQDIEGLAKSVAMMAGFINPDPTLEDWFREEMGLPMAAPTQDPYAINSDNPSGGEGDNGGQGGGGDKGGSSDNTGDNSGGKAVDNSGDNANKGSQGASGGKDQSEEGANDSGASGTKAAEPANSWLLDATMDAIERGVLHLEDDPSVKLFSIGRGVERAGPHMGAGEFNAQHERWGNGRFRDMFNHAEHASHHEAVQEHGGGSGHDAPGHGGSARRSYGPRDPERGYSADHLRRLRAQARARGEDAPRLQPRRGGTLIHPGEERVISGPEAHQRPLSRRQRINVRDGEAILNSVRQHSLVADGADLGDTTYLDGHGKLTLKYVYARRAVASVEQALRADARPAIVAVTAQGGVHELGPRLRAPQSLNAAARNAIVGGALIINHPLGGAPTLRELQAAADLGMRQLRVVTPFFRHSISLESGAPLTTARFAHIKTAHVAMREPVTQVLENAVRLGAVSPHRAMRQAGHALWTAIQHVARIHYTRVAWDEESALMREPEDGASVKLFGIHVGEPGGARGHGSWAGESLHPRDMYGRWRDKPDAHQANIHERTAARHHGDEEHGGGQGHESSRASREKSPNEGTARRSAGKAKGEGAAKSIGRGGATLEHLSPYRDMAHLHTEQEMRAFLKGTTQRRLQSAVREIQGQHPGTRPNGPTNQAKIDYIVAHLTGRGLERASRSEAKAPVAKKPAAPKAPKESAAVRNAREIAALHETSAKWQAENHAPSELKPGEKLVASGQVAGHKFDPYAHLDPTYLAGVYGEHALGAALSRYSVGRLREAGTDLGLKNMGTSRAVVVSHITAHVTNGHYSANFPKESAKASKVPRATGKAKTASAKTQRYSPAEFEARAREEGAKIAAQWRREAEARDREDGRSGDSRRGGNPSVFIPGL